MVIGIALGIGILRGWSVIPSALPNTNIAIQGIVTDDPVSIGSRMYLSLRVHGRPIEAVSRPFTVSFGDRIEIVCSSWRQPSAFQRPWCRASRIDVLSTHAANPVLRAIHGTKMWFESAIKHVFPEPQSSFLAGLLLGSREDMPKELTQAFRTTGTSHIVAVSGYNVTIVVTVIAIVFRTLPLPRAVQFAGTVCAIAGFVILTGASPSVVRAGIMGSLVVLGREVGRLNDVLHALILSSCVMVFIDPSVVTSIGFQLSVTATLGLIVFAEPFEDRFRFMPFIFGLRSSLASTLGAIIATQPLISLYFGQVSVIAPFVNLMVLPIIPLAMLSGFCVALVGALLAPAVPYIGWLAWAPLKAIVVVVDVAAKVPGASLYLPGPVSVVVAVVAALGVAMLGIRIQKHHARA